MANRQVREIGDLKDRNRLAEQQQLVSKLKEDYKSYRQIALMSGISLKTVHNWCSIPKQKLHKSTELAKLHWAEFEQFLIQDKISFAHPSKK